MAGNNTGLMVSYHRLPTMQTLRLYNLAYKNVVSGVRSRLQERGPRPFEFARSVPCYCPSETVAYGSTGYPRNSQTESLLQFLELPHLLGDKSESTDAFRSPFPGIDRGSVGEFSEDIPINDKDDWDEFVADNELLHVNVSIWWTQVLTVGGCFVVKDTYPWTNCRNIFGSQTALPIQSDSVVNFSCILNI